MLKNLLLVFVALLSVYLYVHPRTETRVITQAAAPVKILVPAPAPTPVPKVYYHSPLDASAMSTSASTGTGYFSNDSTSRFSSGIVGSYGPTHGSYQAASGQPVYYPAGSSNTLIYNNYNTGTRTYAQPTPVPQVIVGRLPNR